MVLVDPKVQEREIKMQLNLYYYGNDYAGVEPKFEGIEIVQVHLIEVDLEIHNAIKITFHATRPGILIGKKGQEIDKLKKYLEGIYENCKIELYIKEFDPWR